MNSSLADCSAISANSKFFYVGSLYGVFQYDLEAADIPSSVIQVAQYDTNQSGLWFSQMQLAPDGKIYIATYNGSPYLHVINQPDSLGLLSNVVQSQIVMPSHNTSTMPNFPNYDLGPLVGSPCDTLYLGNVSTINKNATFRISPNPVSNWLNIVYSTEEDGVLNLLDVNGKKVAETSLFRYFKNRLLNVSQLPAGVYLAVVTENGEKVWSEKVVVVH